jgi:glycosyltransferase involved in cell wall biosynthesis
MMRIAFVTRSTLYDVPGGDTIQALQTVKQLRELGIEVDISLTHDKINYSRYDLFHFINITRPSDILFHIAKTKKPFALSPILIDYSEYDRLHRKGLSGLVLSRFPANTHEYIKTFSRWVSGNDSLQSRAYIWKGQRKSIQEIINRAAILLPNSEAEYRELKKRYNVEKMYSVVPNGIDPLLFHPDEKTGKDNKLVLCAARIEGIKNQLNLIRALNNTAYTLMLAGSPAPNQKKYYNECRKIASKNILFLNQVPQELLLDHYKAAKVHALPSWFETCGLSSLEAAAMGCNVVITEKGYTREYFGDDAFYCDPGDPESVFNAVENASQSDCRKELQQRILRDYTWQRAAAITLEAYKKILPV